LILYLDTSALVKAYVVEDHSSEVLQRMKSASASASHRIAYVEARAALVRLQREQVLDESEWQMLKDEFIADWENYLQIDTTSQLLERASVFACYDRKLNQAAGILGIDLLVYNA